MPVSTFTFKVDSELKDAFTLAARENDREVVDVLTGFMGQYVKNFQDKEVWATWFDAKIIKARAEVTKSKTLDEAAVLKNTNKRKEQLISGSIA